MIKGHQTERLIVSMLNSNRYCLRYFRWAEVKSKSDDYEKDVEKTLPLAQKYDEVMSPFIDWLSATEAKLNLVEETALKQENIKEALKELGTIQDDVNTRARDWETVQQCGEALLNTAQEDKKVVDAEIGKTDKRWAALRKNIESTSDRLQQQRKTLEDFEEGVNIMEEVFTPCEAVLGERKSCGLSDDVVKREINKIDELLATIEERRAVADKIPKLYEDLTKDVEETDPEAVAMKETVNDIYTKYQDVPEKLKSMKGTLENEAEHLAAFNELVR
jgi:DNA repair exonuclease SbcCD ATPase subunit